MRAQLLSLVVGSGCLALAALLAPVGLADDVHFAQYSHGDHSAGPRLETVRGLPATSVGAGLGLPPVEPYREAFFFPKDSPAAPKSDQVRDIAMYDNYYSPSVLYVKPGMTVRWTNRGKHHHTTTANWLWESGELSQGASVSLTFTRSGTYYYYCREHPYWMRGTIVVYY